MVSISLCMIVKNEEDVLARALDSVKELADEIIIVDTGSEDRTKDIARHYTQKVFDLSGRMISQQPGILHAGRRRWITGCGWMQTISSTENELKKMKASKSEIDPDTGCSDDEVSDGV